MAFEAQAASSVLARFGGPPAVSPEELTAGLGRWPDVRDCDVDAVVRVLRSDCEPWGFLHPEVEAFQNAYRAFVGTRHCLALSSGTAALHLAVLASGAQAGDEIITPALGFIASATCILHHNCIPVFADVDPDTSNLSPASVEALIGPRTRAILAVDLLGLPADYEAIRALARRHGLAVIEDASQAQGATYGGRRAGSLGDVSALSIMPSKNLPGGGEGGLVTTDDDEIFSRILGHASHGMHLWSGDAPRPVSYELGFNYRPTPSTMAFARQQLQRLPHYQALRSDRADRFAQLVGDIDFLQLPRVPENSTHAFQMFRMRVDPEALDLPLELGEHLRDAFVFLLHAEGALVGFWERELLPAMALFQNLRGYGGGCPWKCSGSLRSYDPSNFPAAQRILDTYLMAPVCRATTSLEFVERQALAYRKVADHRTTLRTLALRFARAGGFHALTGVDICDAHAQRSMRLSSSES